MERQEALEAFFARLGTWFYKPVKYDIVSDDDGQEYARIWFNNEYPMALRLEVVLTLWPDAILDPDD